MRQKSQGGGVLGSTLDLPTRDWLDRTIPDQLRLVVFGGDCTACSLGAFNPTKLTGPPDQMIVVVFATSSESFPEEFKRLPPNFRIVDDPIGQVFDRVNGPTFGQSFMVNMTNQITWASEGPGDWPKGVTYAE